ncbi:uncharacterized protein LOC105212038 [Zeugodacus cucurbitae]|uniref:uncharacterized protein LOC105212038 n=1 Tax=Zeugodacus cucurbitae TaxID=28588 RepID=UPI0023D8F983|nr:uncharacterized protein LOC105212038 [Zeugodacus cucurbitae]
MWKKFLKYLLLFIVTVQITVLLTVMKCILKTENQNKTADFDELSKEVETPLIKAQKAPTYEQSIILVRHFLHGDGGYIALSYNVFGDTIEHPHSEHVIFPYYELFEPLDGNQPWLRVFLLRTTDQTKPQTWEQHLQGFDANGQYFIGLELFHFIANLQGVKLLALFRDTGDTEYLRYAIYDDFVMGGPTEGYRIKKLGMFLGNTENWLSAYFDKPYVGFNVTDPEERQRYEDRCPMLALQGWWGGANLFCKLPLSFRGSLELYIRPINSTHKLMEI